MLPAQILSEESAPSLVVEDKRNSQIDLGTQVLGSSITYGQLFSDPEIAALNQQPVYNDPKSVIGYMCLLSEAPPLTDKHEIIALKDDLARLHEEKGYIVQAGLCAEDIDGLSSDIDAYAEKFLSMMTGMKNEMAALRKPVVQIGRYAGQFAKPRTNAYEDKEKKILTFRGTNVNGPGLHDRVPRIDRMADGNRFASRALTSLRKLETDGHIYASHEGLHLANEIGYLRETTEGELYAGSAPMIWIGERTRDPKGLHVKFASMVMNPIGLKCGPSMKPDELRELIDTLNPKKEKGKLVLIMRMGVDRIDTSLPPLLEVVRENADSVLTIVDPMHGNTVTDKATGKKTRRINAIKTEERRFIELCHVHGVHPAGLHLEASGEMVTECLGDGVDSLTKNNRSLCDPCLNPVQDRKATRKFVAVERRLTLE